jgi:transposase
LKGFQVKLVKVGIESGLFTPHLNRVLASLGFPTVCMDARRAADGIKCQRIKSDNARAWALAEMLRMGRFTAAHVKFAESHKIKTLLGARFQHIRVKLSLGNQVRGLLRPFGVRLTSRAGMKKFAVASYKAVQKDDLMHAGISALLETLASIDAQIAKFDDELKAVARRSEAARRLMSVPSIGTITAPTFIGAIEDPHSFQRKREIGAYLGQTEKRYQSADTDIGLGISKQGDAMARHYLYEAANVLLTTVRKRSDVRSWGLKLLKKIGPKRARVAVARKLAVLLGQLWKDGTHFEAMAA